MELKEQEPIKKKNISAKICKKILKEVNNFDNLFFSHFNKTKNPDNSNKKKKEKRKNAYTVFSSKFRSKIKQENPDKSFGKISKIIGNEWNNLSPDEKYKYRNEALLLNQITKDALNNKEQINESVKLDDKAQNILFQKRLDKLVQTCHNILFDIIIKDISNNHNISQENLVKCISHKNKKFRKNAYTIYSSLYRKEIKKQHPEKNFGEISKIVGKMWKNLSNEEKNIYKLEAENINKSFE